ncbi:hypothetical protein TNCV_3398551 [Trichonephila clavipes]|nr:hypothetical protein TNCV_3398551 [Trichonephila clavipes]
MIRKALKLGEFNIEWKHRPGTQNAVTDFLSRNPVESITGEKVNCAIIKDLVLASREQLIEEQRKHPGLGHIYRNLDNPENSSVNATICQEEQKGRFGKVQIIEYLKEHCRRSIQLTAICQNLESSSEEKKE